MIRKLLASLLIGLTTMFSSGCIALVGAGAAAAGVYYMQGELKSIEDASLADSLDATQGALKDLGFSAVKGQKESPVKATVTAKDLRDKPVMIALEKVTEQDTRFRIRVGTFGNEQMSIRILRRIREEL